jgi:hypothetical protein
MVDFDLKQYQDAVRNILTQCNLPVNKLLHTFEVQNYRIINFFDNTTVCRFVLAELILRLPFV